NEISLIFRRSICVLLDIRSISGPGSIYHLWMALNLSSNVGGAPGEIVAFKGRSWEKPCNPPGSSPRCLCSASR
ncbi:hypothetical protein BJV74DRAFT_774451, partial [Russula compacta]